MTKPDEEMKELLRFLNQLIDGWGVENDDCTKEIRRRIEQGKPKVSREFVDKWWWKIRGHMFSTDDSRSPIFDMLREAGVEVEDA